MQNRRLTKSFAESAIVHCMINLNVIGNGACCVRRGDTIRAQVVVASAGEASRSLTT
jgi:hypothetical protein